MKFWLLIAGARTSKAAAAPIVAVNIAIARARRISAPAKPAFAAAHLRVLPCARGIGMAAGYAVVHPTYPDQ
jgi:hypothetical protein